MSACGRRCHAGFGLLEAIVALALFAAGGMVLFSWINSSIANASRIQSAEISTRLSVLGSEWIQALDPAERPAGEIELAPGVSVQWRSRALTPPTPVAPFPGGTDSRFDLRLFEVEAVVTEGATGTTLSLLQNRLGVRQRDSFNMTTGP